MNVTATVSTLGSAPGVSHLLFNLDGTYLLTDFASPYTFRLPSTHFIDGSHSLSVVAVMRDGFNTSTTLINVRFSNGISQPPVNHQTFTPSRGSTPASGQPFVLAAAGDGASGENPAVTDLIASWSPNLFLYLGDVYEKGTYTEMYNWYGTATQYFGQFRSITNPIIGNHEYEKNVAPGYFFYWNNIPDYYSYNTHGWHFIALNSNSELSQQPGSPQYEWLAQDLNNNSAACTLAYFHHPIYSIGPQGDTPRMDAIWALLEQHGVDIILTGHDHSYERWKPLDVNGNVNTQNGITTFVVGTGGHGIQHFVRQDNRVVAGFDTSPTAFGALKMLLNPSSTTFQFINTAKNVLDSGTIACHGASSVTPTPTPTPAGPVTFTPVADTWVDASAPTTNRGSSSFLHTDGSPVNNGYVRFNVQGVSGVVTSAALRIYANSASSTGLSVHSMTNNTWGELTTTYSNAPGFGSIIGSSASFGTGTWLTFDVTARVSGNGLVSFALTSAGQTAISFSSREGANKPQLIVQVSSQGGAAVRSLAPMLLQPVLPTDTMTASWTATPTETATFMPTLTLTPAATMTESVTDTQTPIETAEVTAEPTHAVTEEPTVASTMPSTVELLPTALPFPTLPPPPPPTDLPTALPFPTLPPPASPTLLPTRNLLPLPALATMDDGATDWQATSGWRLTSEGAYGGSGLSWQLETNSSLESLRWETSLDLRSMLPTQSIQLSFISRLHLVSGMARVELSTDGGSQWQTAAIVSPSDDWSIQSVDVSAFAGQIIELQFVWEASPAANSLDAGTQWGLDQVSLQITGTGVTTATAESGSATPLPSEALTDSLAPMGTPSLTATDTPSPTPSSTATAIFTATATPTDTPTSAASPTDTPVVTSSS